MEVLSAFILVGLACVYPGVALINLFDALRRR